MNPTYEYIFKGNETGYQDMERCLHPHIHCSIVHNS